MAGSGGRASCQGESRLSETGSISSVEAVSWPAAMTGGAVPRKRLP